MRFQIFTIVVCLLLTACGQEMSGNREGITRDPIKPDTDTMTLYSGLIRDYGATPIKYSEEMKLYSSLPAYYSLFPRMDLDDEGKDGVSVMTRQKLTRPSENCGLDRIKTVKERIKECADINGAKATWNGANFSSSTEGRWDLVALKKGASKNIEIWMDRRTGMVWSDVYSATNWCQASGNDEKPSTTISIDCFTLNKKNTCLNEDLLGLSGIVWRLPTRNDFLQADLNGIRFVVPKGDGNGFWTATLSSSATQRDQAWVYNSDNGGTLVAEKLDSLRQVRCIGAPIK